MIGLEEVCCIRGKLQMRTTIWIVAIRPPGLRPASPRKTVSCPIWENERLSSVSLSCQKISSKRLITLCKMRKPMKSYENSCEKIRSGSKLKSSSDSHSIWTKTIWSSSEDLQRYPMDRQWAKDSVVWLLRAHLGSLKAADAASSSLALEGQIMPMALGSALRLLQANCGRIIRGRSKSKEKPRR